MRCLALRRCARGHSPYDPWAIPGVGSVAAADLPDEADRHRAGMAEIESAEVIERDGPRPEMQAGQR